MNTVKTLPVASIHYVSNSVSPMRFGASMPIKERIECRDINDWLEAQDEAEVSFLVAEMAMRNNRTNRLSAYG